MKSKDSAKEMSAQLRRLQEELPRVLPGWRHLASDVRVDGELVADLIGKIGARLVFVHHLVGAKEEVIQGTMSRVSRAQMEAGRLGQKLSVSGDIAPLVVVITEGKVKGVLKRLDALCPDPLVLLADRRLSTLAGRARFLEVLTPMVEAVAPDIEETGPSKELPPQPASDWELVIARVDRIDPEIQREEDKERVRWSWGGEALCSIEVSDGGRILGRIGPQGVPHDLSARRSLEVFLDWVLARHLELMEAGPGEDLRDVELMPHPSEPLLTPEEMAAFQE